MAAQILRIDNFFADVLHTPALRPAVRLLLRIMVKRSISIKEAMMDSPLSYRAFYIMIDRLKEAGLIDVASDDSDRRVRLLVLGSEFNRMIVKLPAYLEKAEAEEIRLEKEAVSEFR
jgi:DNA-binding MarR family transcriptional regulator